MRGLLEVADLRRRAVRVDVVDRVGRNARVFERHAHGALCPLVLGAGWVRWYASLDAP
jgi:hypothetical protein